MVDITHNKTRLIKALGYLDHAESDLLAILTYNDKVRSRIRGVLVSLRTAKTFMGEKKKLVQRHRYLQADKVETSFCNKCFDTRLVCDNCSKAININEEYVCFNNGIHGCKECYEGTKHKEESK
jgi:hypothetical protein